MKNQAQPAVFQKFLRLETAVSATNPAIKQAAKSAKEADRPCQPSKRLLAFHLATQLGFLLVEETPKSRRVVYDRKM